MSKILILGGYGNFGRRIAMALAKFNCHIVIAGRSVSKARQCAEQILIANPSAQVESATIDINTNLSEALVRLQPIVVINTCGPFQQRDYTVANCCVEHKANYIDLADARDYVSGINILDQKAKDAGVLIVCGASSVPGLSSAVLEEYKDHFSEIESLRYGISPGQRIDLGLATTQSLLSYIGKPLKPFAGHPKTYGWQQSYQQPFPEIGTRWMSACDVPDLDLLPPHYGIKSIQFSAGMELKLVHGSLWLLGWLIRLGFPLNLPKLAPVLLRLNRWLYPLGSSNGGMHITIKGKDTAGAPKTIEWFIIAKDGDGPQIPTIPAIILAKKLSAKDIDLKGAVPCIGLVSLTEYLDALKEFNIAAVQKQD